MVTGRFAWSISGMSFGGVGLLARIINEDIDLAHLEASYLNVEIDIELRGENRRDICNTPIQTLPFLDRLLETSLLVAGNFKDRAHGVSLDYRGLD